MLGAIFLFFTALEELPLADATAIAFGAPFVMLLLSRPVLGERVPAVAWGAVAIGFVGVLVIVQPGGNVKPAALLAVGASILYAIGMLTTRRLGRTESVFSMLFWMIAGQFVIAVLTLPFVWHPVDARHWPLLAALAIFNLLGQLGLVRAFSLAPPSVVAPFEYTALLWAAALGLIVFGDVPSARLLGGAVIIMGAGLYVTLRTRPAGRGFRRDGRSPGRRRRAGRGASPTRLTAPRRRDRPTCRSRSRCRRGPGRGSPTARGDPLEPVGDDLVVLDVVARRVDHAGDQHHAVGKRLAREAARTRGRGARWPSTAPARRRAPRTGAAGCSFERHVEGVRALVVAPADVQPDARRDRSRRARR